MNKNIAEKIEILIKNSNSITLNLKAGPFVEALFVDDLEGHPLEANLELDDEAHDFILRAIRAEIERLEE